MHSMPLTLVKARTAEEVCRTFQLYAPSRPLLRAGQSPREFLDVLMAGKHWEDAVRFLAYALPPREAVWWGCLSAWLASDPGRSPAEREALRAAARWVLQPTAEHCQACHGPGKAAERDQPGSYLAEAAEAGDGAVTGLTARLAAVGINLAVAHAPMAEREDRYREYLALGIAIAGGRYPWPSSP